MSSTLLNSIPFIIESELNPRLELTERPCERHSAHTIVFLDFKYSRVFVFAEQKFHTINNTVLLHQPATVITYLTHVSKNTSLIIGNISQQ